ncbi:hypothetical protein LUZ61_012475 [Rhynchospora tenuis]|uniref:60S ribosome subunit biogenesis protein NIP7 pre-PUA domain-containing protein n=1 Tax=Rhynchospora tenuis TaxID=198213 RepID=A0AAD6A361_9POAL|nr:hypothetical protein LUZ61_012475 [Rhynchospora tenuis]
MRSFAMRPLDEKETTLVFEKLFKFVDPNLKHIIERPAVGDCFWLHKNRVYYFSEPLVRRSTFIVRPKRVSLGLPIAKITKSGQFRITIHSLVLLTEHERNKICQKPAEDILTFLYGVVLALQEAARACLVGLFMTVILFLYFFLVFVPICVPLIWIYNMVCLLFEH